MRTVCIGAGAGQAHYLRAYLRARLGNKSRVSVTDGTWRHTRECGAHFNAGCLDGRQRRGKQTRSEGLPDKSMVTMDSLLIAGAKRLAGWYLDSPKAGKAGSIPAVSRSSARPAVLPSS